ncbi:MAG: ComEC/Rec2 family competence protein [Aliihoeflea sp.]|uniref:ComEC/Rec2 family competence protein n=1 Tax=Aliihoeflea sp. TaxID=2608088 RepID=UPI0040338584
MAGDTRQDEEWRAFVPPGEADVDGMILVHTETATPLDAAPVTRREVSARTLPIGAAAARAVSDERDRGTGFILLPVAMAVGVVVYGALPFEPSLWLVVSALAALLLLASLCRAWPAISFIVLALFATMAGVGLAGLETWRTGTAMMGSEIGTEVTGRVVRIEHQATGRTRLTLDVASTARPELRYAPDRVRLSARNVPAELQLGMTIVGIARLMPPSGPVRPGGYDFAYNSYFDGIGAIGFFLRDPELAASSPPPDLRETLVLRLEAVRLAIAARVRAVLSGAEGEIAATLTAGVRAGIPETVNEDLRKTGLAHILSISGLHMALVAGTVLVAIRGGLALFPVFASRRPVKKYAAIVALIAATLYLGISGGAVAAQRSYIMLAVMLVAILFDRAAITMRNLAISAIIVIAISPHEVVGPSFQMSFAATAALIGAYGWWSEPRRVPDAPRAERGAIGRLAAGAFKFMLGLAATSVIAGLATTLYGAYHFHRVSPHALWVNLSAMPIVSAIIMPFAVLSALMMPFGLEALPLRVMGAAIGVVTDIAAWFAARSPIDAVGSLPVAAVAVLTVGLVAMTALSGKLRLIALPFLILGTGLIANRDLPDVLVSEDGRLVAIAGQGRTLHVNRSRPNGFTIQNWLHGMDADRVQPPADAATPAEAIDQASTVPGFSCAAKTCVAQDEQGRLVAHVPDAIAAFAFCTSAALIVIDDATAGNVCRTGEAAIVTKQDLARRGSAEIQLGNAGALPNIIHAIREPYRPWHSHRQFSREARGMPPYRRD